MKRTLFRITIVFMVLCSSFVLVFNNIEAIAMSKTSGRINKNLQISAAGALLIDLESGKVLYDKNHNKRMYPASTTKILTALVAIEFGDLEEIITVNDEIMLMDKDSSRAWLRIGEKMKLSDLVMGLMLPSGNDAAYSIAVNVGRKLIDNPLASKEEALEAFVGKMNERAKEIGATKSNFVNPHGIHDVNHYTTPYDMALIAKEAMKYNFFKKVVRTLEYDGVNTKGEGHLWFNTNRLLNPKDEEYFRYTTGIKTGHTTPAGYCLVSSAEKDDMKVLAVVLKDDDGGQWLDSRTLLNYGLVDFTHYKITEKGQVIDNLGIVNKQPWEKRRLSLIAQEECTEVLNKADIKNIRVIYEWRPAVIKSFQNNEIELQKSIRRDEVLGKAKYFIDSQEIATIEIKAGMDMNKKWIIFDLPGAMFLYDNWMLVLLVLLIMLSSAFTIMIKRKSK